MTTNSLTYPATAQPTVNVVHDWAAFGQGQQEWCVPPLKWQILFFIGGAMAPVIANAPGLIAVFLLAAVFPTSPLRKLFKKSKIGFLSVQTAVMFIGNFDAFADLLGNDTIRLSWVSVILGAVLLLFQLKFLIQNATWAFLMIATFLAIQVFSALGKPSMLTAIEINGSYGVAFLLILAVVIKRPTRDGLASQLCLVMMVNAGFCLHEMLNPYTSVSISSSVVGDEIRRSAGVYANAITSGLMMSAALLFVGIACSKPNASFDSKRALMGFAFLVGVGTVVTFSRSAALVYFLAVFLVALRIANNKMGKLGLYIPLSLLIVLVSFFGTGEILTQNKALKRDATKRYDMVKEVAMGRVSHIRTALDERMGAWQPTKRFWTRPRPLGMGCGFVAERGYYPPHNMVILLLIEVGWMGLIMFGALLLVLSGIGVWQINAKNLYLFASIMLPIMLILIESHSMFTRRYFAIHLVLLYFITHVLLNPKRRVD